MSEEYRPRVTKYLVMWPDKNLGGFEREDILCCALAENRWLGEAQIFKLICTLPTIYEPIATEEVRAIASPKAPIHLDNAAASFA